MALQNNNISNQKTFMKYELKYS